ncbi:carbohydrate-binding protein [Brevibacillus dissolubilis]|uniref:carbohydrate-binding protein n=1 Tax=Brevibacillus dissolubilis TaxID=1844116 RepID=UPI0011179BE3
MRAIKQKSLLIFLVVMMIASMVQAASAAAAAWAPNVAYKVGDLVSYQSYEYKCIQAHTSLTGWEPPNVPALWEKQSGTTNPPPPTGDTQAPSTPTNLTSSNITSSSVGLSWSASTDNTGVTGYHVYRGTTLVATSTTTSYTVTGLAASTTYSFTVKAKDAAGNLSASSNSVSITTLSSTTPPPTTGTGTKVLVGYWHNFDNGSTTLKLREVSGKYDVIQVAFAEPTGADHATMGFIPYNATVSEFKSDIAYLKSQGKKVLISIGGANGVVELHTEAAKQSFISSMSSIIETYGFDGLDIDLEGGSLSLNPGDTDFKNPTTPKVVNLISAVRTLSDKYGTGFMVTMAPETAYVQGGLTSYGGPWGAYLPVIYGLRDKMNFIHVQHYNSGSMEALDGKSYAQGTADFQVAMAEMLLKGFPIARNSNNVFPSLKPEQVAIGLPSSPSAAGGGYTTNADMDRALNYLVKGVSYGGTYKLQNPAGYPGFKGVMTWSINWDAKSGYLFANGVRSTLDLLK